jgi:hypothetical protein
MNNVNLKSETPFTITGNWAKQSKVLMEKFEQLTEADLMFVAGKENDLITRLEKRLNKKREEVINIIKKGMTV